MPGPGEVDMDLLIAFEAPYLQHRPSCSSGPVWNTEALKMVMCASGKRIPNFFTSPYAF